MMHEFLLDLARGALAAGLALGVVLVLRVPARRRLGAAFAYRLWLLVPVAVSATLVPAPVRPLLPALVAEPTAMPAGATIDLRAAIAESAPVDWQPYLLALWIGGALALFATFVHQQRRYTRNLGALSANGDGILRAQATTGCPALVGMLRPRIVVPGDFESRYTAAERELVLAHERMHLARGDAQINAFAAFVRCLNWFNPLIHFAASRFRFDQEIACDAAVMSRFPEARRCYADAMLKAQLAGKPRQEPAGCLWPAGHPLKERIAMLKFPVPTRTRRVLASVTIVVLMSSAGYASWAAQPGRTTVEAAAGAAADTTVPGGIEAQPDAKFVQSDFSLTIDGVRAGSDRWQPGNSEGTRWAVSFDTTKDVVVQSSRNETVTMLNRFGDTFKISASRAGDRWEVEALARDRGDGTLEFNGTIRHNGTMVSQPRLVVIDGAPAALQVHDGAQADEKTFKLDFTLHKTGSGQPTENLSYRRLYPPKYPAEAVRNHISGKVVLKVAVDESGVPTSAEVLSAEPEESAHALADAAVAAAMQWRYNPGIKDGKPVGGDVLVPVDFMLDDENGASLMRKEVGADASVSYRKMRPPVYPKEAIAAKISGVLYVRAHVDPQGNVAEAYVDQVVPVSALALKDAAVVAVKSWQFNPSTRNGRPIESDVLVPMRFRLDGATETTSNAGTPVYPDFVKRLESIVITAAAN